ncbi:MAG: twin-arginine translocation signal domain-containing protein, partial [Sphingomonadales bacterium]
MTAFSRRDFLKTSAAGALALGAGTRPLFAAEE